MGIILEADNRILTTGSKYSYLVTNYSAEVTSFFVLNATDSQFDNGVFLLLSNFGAEDAEVVQIASSGSNWDTGEIILTEPTLFAHAESTRVTILPYDQIRFFHTATDTFDTNTALTNYINIQPSDWFTTFTDENFSDGYGWYTFYDSTNALSSQPSNAIPYIGFDENTTESILSDFFSMLNNKELKLVTREDALSWASEGYGRMRNKLNLTNSEYTASEISALPIQSGVIEYDLPTDFDHLISFLGNNNGIAPGVSGHSNPDISFIPLREAYTYNGSTPRYYIRGFKIGIIPAPSINTTYYYMYNKKAARLSLNTDIVDLPNGGEYLIKDYMLYRANQKFQNPVAKGYLESFTNGLNDMIISSVKRDANLDKWGAEKSSNV